MNENIFFICHITLLGRWSPVFTDYNGDSNVQVKDFYLAVGVPECGRMQMWPIYYYPSVCHLRFEFMDFFFTGICIFQSRDKLALLPDGRLRHYIQNPDQDDPLPADEKSLPMHYDYDQGRYCMDKVCTHFDAQSISQLMLSILCS